MSMKYQYKSDFLTEHFFRNQVYAFKSILSADAIGSSKVFYFSRNFLVDFTPFALNSCINTVF